MVASTVTRQDLKEGQRLLAAAAPRPWTVTPGKISRYPFVMSGGRALFTPAGGHPGMDDALALCWAINNAEGMATKLLDG